MGDRERNVREKINDPAPKGPAAPAGGLAGNAPSNENQDRHLKELGIGPSGSHVPSKDDTNQGTDEKGQGGKQPIEKGGREKP